MRMKLQVCIITEIDIAALCVLKYIQPHPHAERKLMYHPQVVAWLLFSSSAWQ